MPPARLSQEHVCPMLSRNVSFFTMPNNTHFGAGFNVLERAELTWIWASKGAAVWRCTRRYPIPENTLLSLLSRWPGLLNLNGFIEHRPENQEPVPDWYLLLSWRVWSFIQIRCTQYLKCHVKGLDWACHTPSHPFTLLERAAFHFLSFLIPLPIGSLWVRILPQKASEIALPIDEKGRIAMGWPISCQFPVWWAPAGDQCA